MLFSDWTIKKLEILDGELLINNAGMPDLVSNLTGGKIGFILGVSNELLKTHRADSNETLRVHRVYSESVQRHIYILRSRPRNRLLEFSHDVIYVLCIKYLRKRYKTGSGYISLTKARIELCIPSKFHGNRLMHSRENRI